MSDTVPQAEEALRKADSELVQSRAKAAQLEHALRGRWVRGSCLYMADTLIMIACVLHHSCRWGQGAAWGLRTRASFAFPGTFSCHYLAGRWSWTSSEGRLQRRSATSMPLPA